MTYAAAALGAVIVFFLDRATKLYFLSLPPAGLKPTNGWLSLVRHKNFGIIADFPLPLWLIVALTLMVTALVLSALRTSAQRRDIKLGASLGILLGGALGNLFDRVTQGYVFDWILVFGRSAMNLADAAIVIGALWYFLQKHLDERRKIAQGTSQPTQ